MLILLSQTCDWYARTKCHAPNFEAYEGEKTNAIRLLQGAEEFKEKE